MFVDDTRVLFHDAASTERLAAWTAPDDVSLLWPSISRDGRTVALADQSGGTVLFDVTAILDGASPNETARVIRGLSTGPTHSVIVSGNRLISSGGGTQIRVRDLMTERLILDVATTAGDAADIVIAPDGSSLLYEDAGAVLRRLPLDFTELVILASSRAQRGFTEAECARFFGDETCP